MSRKHAKQGARPSSPPGDPDGGDAKMTFHLRLSPGAPDKIIAASAYTVDQDEASVRVWFYFSEAPRLAPSVVVLPRAMLGRMVLRERPKLRAPMTAWAAKPHPAARVPCDNNHPNASAFASNFAHVAVSDVGALVRFFWASPSDVHNTPNNVTASPVLEVRLPSEVLARLWLELDQLAGPDDPDVVMGVERAE